MLVGEPADQRLRLPAPQIVEADAGGSPGQDAGGVGRGASMAHQNDGHSPTLVAAPGRRSGGGDGPGGEQDDDRDTRMMR